MLKFYYSTLFNFVILIIELLLSYSIRRVDKKFKEVNIYL